MDAEAEAGGLCDVFHDLHLCPVVAHAVDVEPFVRRLDIGRDTVDHRILATLGAVDPFETLRRIGAREGAQVMRDRVEVAIGPEGDPGEAAAGIEVYCVSTAPHLGRRQQHPIAKASAADIGLSRLRAECL